MKRKTKPFVIACAGILACSAALLSPVRLFAAVDQLDYLSILEQKIAMEKNLEKRLHDVIESILGSDKFVTILSIEPDTERTEIERETWVQKKDEGEEPFAMPGVPLKKRVGEEEKQKVPSNLGMDRQYEKIVKLPKSFIKKISVTIILDNRVTDEIVDTIRKVAVDLLGIDEVRGDRLTITKQNLVEPPRKKATVWDILTKKQVYIPLMAALFSTLFYFITRLLLKGIAEIYKAAQEKQKETIIEKEKIIEEEGKKEEKGEEEGEGEEGEGGEAEEVDEFATAEEEQQKLLEEEEKPTGLFAFINDENSRQLSYLIQSEPSENITMVLSYLPSHLATKVMSYFPQDIKMEVAKSLATPRPVSPELAKLVEEDIRKKIDFVVGGMEHLVGILDEADNKTRNEILAFLEKTDPGLSRQLRESMVTFETILSLELPEVRTVLREISVGTLALALKGTRNEIRTKIMEGLSEGATAMLMQELDLGKPATKETIEEAQRKVAQTVRKLEREGRIIVKRPEGEAAEKAEAAGTAGGVEGMETLPDREEDVEVLSEKSGPWKKIATIAVVITGVIVIGYWASRQPAVRNAVQGIFLKK